MIDERTPHLALPLPHADNLLEEDVARLRQALTGIDAAIAAQSAAVDAAIAAQSAAVDAAIAAQSASVDAAIAAQSASVDAAIAAEQTARAALDSRVSAVEALVYAAL